MRSAWAGACQCLAAEAPLVRAAAARNAVGWAGAAVCGRRPTGRVRRCAAIGCRLFLRNHEVRCCWRVSPVNSFRPEDSDELHVNPSWPVVNPGTQALPTEPLAATASNLVCASCQQMEGWPLLPASGLLAAAALGMLKVCDALPQSAAQGSLAADAVAAAPCVLAVGGTAQLLLCTVGYWAGSLHPERIKGH
jgi:hypothetical protein